MKNRWIVCLVIIFVLSSSVGFAGHREPEDVNYELDGRLELLRSISDIPDSTSHYGNVSALDDRTFAVAISEMNQTRESGQIHLLVYDESGNLIQEVSGGNTSSCDAPIFVFQSKNGNFYTTDGLNLFESDSVMSGLNDLGLFPINSGVFQRNGQELGIQPKWIQARGQFYFVEIGDKVELESLQSHSIVASEEEILSIVPESIESAYVIGFDYGETEETVYFLLATGDEIAEDYYVMEAKKTYVSTEEGRSIQWDRLNWTGINIQDELNVPINLYGGQVFAVSDQGLEIAALGVDRNSYLLSFDFNGSLRDQVKVPGQIMFFDSNSNQTAIVSWRGPDFGNALFLMNWKPASAGTPKSLISERTVKGKTLARFRDDGYGLLKTEDPESGSVDYLAPLKTEANEVRLQIPMKDLLSKQDSQAGNLVILYGEKRVAIPMDRLARADLLETLPCQDDATIEIRLSKNHEGIILIEIDLFVVEQVDSVTRLVHRLKINE